MLNQGSVSRLPSWGEIHPSLWITAWFSMHSFKKDSLPFSDHSLSPSMNLVAVTFIYSWRWYWNSQEAGFAHRISRVVLGDWDIPRAAKERVPQRAKHQRRGLLLNAQLLLKQTENRSKGISFLWHLWMHEGQQLITLNWLVYYRFISKRKKWVVIVFWKTHIIFSDTKIKTLFTIELLSTYELNL